MGRLVRQVVGRLVGRAAPVQEGTGTMCIVGASPTSTSHIRWMWTEGNFGGGVAAATVTEVTAV